MHPVTQSGPSCFLSWRPCYFHVLSTSYLDTIFSLPEPHPRGHHYFSPEAGDSILEFPQDSLPRPQLVNFQWLLLPLGTSMGPPVMEALIGLPLMPFLTTCWFCLPLHLQYPHLFTQFLFPCYFLARVFSPLVPSLSSSS